MPDPQDYMRRAIRLSRKGFPAPNPHVGCVIEKDGQIIGEGFHDHAGGPHAEIVALQQAGNQAKNATVYTSQEPCNHYGRTGPCSLALIEAGVRKVVYAVPDIVPGHDNGAGRLRQAGIEVEQGLLEEDARAANHDFLLAHTRKRPIVIVKAAISLDGRIALPTGESQWITSPQARKEAHRLRAEAGAVLVGRGTVEADDPKLTARIKGVVNQPLRIVLDPEGALPRTKAVFNADAETLHFVTTPTREDQTALPQKAGSFDLEALLKHLWEKGQTGLLVEGGAQTIASFIQAGLVDRYEIFVAPKLLGAGPNWVEGLTVESLAQAPALDFKAVRRIGPDIWITATPSNP